MTFPYFVRLAFLSLAAYLLVHLAVAIVVTILAPRAIRAASLLAPARAARRLLMLRLAPAAVAIFVVIAFCIPSYLWLEPDAVEEAGLLCLLLAASALVAWTVSGIRAARAVRDSVRYVRDSLAVGRETAVLAAHAPVCLTDHPGPAVALAGIFNPRVIVSRAAAAALTAEQLDAALRHERAHAQSRDNLKRLAILLVPGLLPRGTLAALENAWACAAECAADDRAAADPHVAVSLAEALVRISHLTADGFSPRIVTPLAAENLRVRVERLLNPSPFVYNAPARTRRWLWLLVALSLVALTVAQPHVLRSVYRLLENLI